MRGRPFPPGTSGNPNGRPKAVGELRTLARAHAPAAIAELARLCTSARSEGTRVAAIALLLDRAYGKPISPPVAIDDWLPALADGEQSDAGNADDLISF